MKQLCGGDLRHQTEFAHFRALAAWKTRVFVISQHVRRTTGATMQTVIPIKLFAQSMHGAELLHAPRYASFVSCKIIAIEFLQVFHIEKSTFPNIFPTKNVPSSTQVYPAGQ